MAGFFSPLPSTWYSRVALILYADSGIENINAAVDATLFSACLERVLAQVDVAYSNSMIEAFWRSLKHQALPFQLSAQAGQDSGDQRLAEGGVPEAVHRSAIGYENPFAHE
jgi:hypothetical protein